MSIIILLFVLLGTIQMSEISGVHYMDNNNSVLSLTFAALSYESMRMMSQRSNQAHQA